MKAIISGQAEAAVVIDGRPLLLSLNRDDPVEIGSNYLHIFSGCTDVKEVIVENYAELRESIQNLWARDRALRLAILIFDESELPEHRQEFGSCLNELLIDFHLERFLRSCFSHAALPNVGNITQTLSVLPRYKPLQQFVAWVLAHQEAAGKFSKILCVEAKPHDSYQRRENELLMTMTDDGTLADLLESIALDADLDKSFSDLLDRYPQFNLVLREWQTTLHASQGSHYSSRSKHNPVTSYHTSSSSKVLVTGGAGFIGCHVVRALLQRGYAVRVLDSLIDQVHGDVAARDKVLDDVELIRADVRDLDRVTQALNGVDSVIHLAAEVGVGQSMYAIDRYVSANDGGTAVLFQALIERPVSRVVVASSMSIYGEGLYRSAAGERMDDVIRPAQRVGAGWDPVGPDGLPLTPMATPEWKRPNLASVYALTKYVQERLTLTVAPAYGMQGVALRLFNVYGPGQALSNPYTGVLAIFASRLHNRQRPMVFEDGEQRRDFVHVDDVARAFMLALEHPDAPGRVFNIGSGIDASILEVGAALSDAMGVPHLTPEVMGKARTGDIRHCFADISLARDVLGFAPRRTLADGLGELADWVRLKDTEHRTSDMQREIRQQGRVA